MKRDGKSERAFLFCSKEKKKEKKENMFTKREEKKRGKIRLLRVG